jgi:hypothetical protein
MIRLCAQAWLDAGPQSRGAYLWGWEEEKIEASSSSYKDIRDETQIMHPAANRLKGNVKWAQARENSAVGL